MAKVASREDWLDARRALLRREKELSRLKDEIAAEVRALPWVKVDADYRFQTTAGEKTLRDLFEGRSQLIVYHFMFDPSWTAGCKSCSFVTDHLQQATVHLRARDVTMVLVSRASLETLLAFKERMGWTCEWVSSEGSDFNFDFHVSFTPEQSASGSVFYNFDQGPPWGSEAPGASVFVRDGDDVFHTYSTYSRGLDRFITTYTWLDTVPKGRDEAELAYGMEWLRLRDEY